MRKEVFLLLVIFLAGFVSASYECSTDFTENTKDASALASTSINSLKIGVINSYSSSVGGVYYANLMIDGEKFVLTNESNSSEFEIQNGEETIELVSLEDNVAEVKIGTSSEEISEEESGTVKDYLVYITKAEGVYPGEADVEGFVGQEKITLDQNTTEKKVSVEDVNYVIELGSITDNGAMITVKKCNGTISEVVDVEEPENNTIVENDTIENETEENQTEIIDTINENSNEIIGVGEIENNQEERGISKIFFCVIIVLTIIGIIAFLIVKMYCSTRDKKAEICGSKNTPPPPENQGNMPPQNQPLQDSTIKIIKNQSKKN